jgi:hypothetical protein
MVSVTVGHTRATECRNPMQNLANLPYFSGLDRIMRNNCVRINVVTHAKRHERLVRRDQFDLVQFRTIECVLIKRDGVKFDRMRFYMLAHVCGALALGEQYKWRTGLSVYKHHCGLQICWIFTDWGVSGDLVVIHDV